MGMRSSTYDTEILNPTSYSPTNFLILIEIKGRDSAVCQLPLNRQRRQRRTRLMKEAGREAVRKAGTETGAYLHQETGEMMKHT